MKHGGGCGYTATPSSPHLVQPVALQLHHAAVAHCRDGAMTSQKLEPSTATGQEGHMSHMGQVIRVDCKVYGLPSGKLTITIENHSI